MSDTFVTVKLKKSLIGRKKSHIGTCWALGLRKLGTSRTHKMTPVLKGMLSQVHYLIKVETATEDAAK